MYQDANVWRRSWKRKSSIPAMFVFDVIACDSDIAPLRNDWLRRARSLNSFEPPRGRADFELLLDMRPPLRRDCPIPRAPHPDCCRHRVSRDRAAELPVT